ncbi:MAG TPA: NAD(P)H-dependent oxidoreductase [Acidimicrobiales bacterium]|nr:NAD(P)H-dependent oxidoreductase [Acidimicrobiales bacterium]
MTADPLALGVIVGSNRRGRFAGTVARWFVGEAERRSDITLDVIDLADVELPARFEFRTQDPRVLAFLERIDRADAFVVITPEYNHSYPAALKHAIDYGKEQWYRKVVGYVSYGGMSGGLRAVEHLRQVFAEVHATSVRETVSFHLARSRFDEQGRPVDPEGTALAAKVMLDDLVWWADALREARRRTRS